MRCPPLIVLMLALSTGPLNAQMVQGQVVDSVTEVPVAGATLLLLDADGGEVDRTVADEEGRFLLLAPGAGEYRLRVAHEGFRASTFPPFALDPDAVRGFMLLVASLTPPPSELSAEDIIARVCPEGVPGPMPVIIGFVRVAATEEIVPGAEVRISTPPVPNVLQDYVGAAEQSRVLQTDADGIYAVCGVPFDMRIAMHAAAGDLLSQFATMTFVDSGVYVGPTFREMDTRLWTQNLNLLPSDQWTASVAGVVTDTAGSGIANVRVSIPDTEFATRADDVGVFRLDRIPPGTVLLEMRQTGYRPNEVQIAVAVGETVEIPEGVLSLTPLPTRLADVTVEAPAPTSGRALSEFETRRRNTTGSFVTRAEFQEEGNPQKPTDVLRRMRGIRIVPGRTGRLIVITSRGQSRTIVGRNPGAQGCFPLYFVNGLFLGDSWDVDIDQVLSMEDVEAIETYTSIGGLPQEFNRPGAACGVIVIWTR